MAKAKELNFVGVKNIVQEVMLFEQEIIKARVKRANSPYNSRYKNYKDMKRTPAVLITLLFALSAIWTAVNDYQTQCRRIADDLTQALCLTVADQPEDWLSADTIRTYRQHLRLDFLRESAVLSLCMKEDDKASARGVSGERINIKQDISAYGM